jgi:predicted PurR-regulated permease PerM
MARVNWQRTRDILICIICICLIFWAAWSVASQFVDVIIILLLSMAVAFLLTPAVNLLARYHVPRVLATFIAYIVVLSVVGGLAYELVFSLIQQAVSFSDTISNFATNLPTNFANFIKFLEVQGHIPDSNIQSAIGQIQAQATDFAKSLATNALNIVVIATGAILNIVLVIVISFYLTVDGKHIRDRIIAIMPRRSLNGVLLFEDALNRVVGNYIRGQLILAFIIGIMASVVCVITGLGNFALIVGVLAFIFETIPMVGPALASIPAILLSLLLPHPVPRTFYVILAFVIIQMIESNILGPRIVGHAVGLHPVASILALLVGAKLFGAFGALIATPILAAIWVVIASFYRSVRGETADQILAHRRAGWTIRRPSGSLRRGATRRSVGKGGGDSGNGASRAESGYETGVSVAEETRLIYPLDEDGEQEQRQERIEQ